MNVSIVKYARSKQIHPPFDVETMRVMRGSALVHSAGYAVDSLPVLRSQDDWYPDIEAADREDLDT